MSDDPTTQRAADVIVKSIYYCGLGEALSAARALAAAGLLTEPTTPAPCRYIITSDEGTSHCTLATTPTLTPEQADVIDAAKGWRRGSVGPHPTDFVLRAAVDRLAATDRQPT